MRIASVIAALLAASCGLEADPQLQITDAPGPHTLGQGKIRGGSAPDAPEHDAVVGLHEVYGEGSLVSWPFCTGTLIDDDIVLTAAHCVESFSGGTLDPSAIRIYVGDDPASDLALHNYEVDEVLKHADYNTTWWFNDIGILRLTDDVAAAEGVTPVPNLPEADAITEDDIGEIMNLVGFGYTETWDYGEKLQVDIALAGLGCAVTGCYGFDNEDTQVSYDQSGGEGVCTGDSGGPLLLERDGQVYVGGVTSFTDYWCNQYGVSTKVDAFESWISDFIGDGAAAACGDGTCDVGESCDGRGTTTACAADCPGQSFGPPPARYCTVNGVCLGPGCG